MVEMFHT